MQTRSLPFYVIGSVYSISHLLLDWLSYERPFGAFGITPWNPSTGLSLFFILVYGWRALWFFCAALLFATVAVRGLPLPLPVALAEVAIRGGFLALAYLTLSRPIAWFARSLTSVRDLFLLLCVALVGSALVAGLHVVLLVTLGLIAPEDMKQALLMGWVGDLIGIAVVTPFGLLAISRKRLISVEWETSLQMGVCVVLTMLVAIIYAETEELQLFYLLFLPLTWIAVRSGIEGVSVALISIQGVLFLVLLLFARRNVDVLDFQARMLILAVTGLIAGALVTERRIAEAQLRMNQHALAQLSRLGSMGELAAAIAHEINQPLSAAGTYTNVVAESLQNEALKDVTVRDMAAKAAGQIARAADVVRRLRTLVRMGKSELTPNSVVRIVQEATDVMMPDFTKHGIALKIDLDPHLPQVMVDRLQVEQVLLNVMRNSLESIVDSQSLNRQIAIHARGHPRFVELHVNDTGAGFQPGFGTELSTPLSTTKADGMGIGLSLCRSIVEAHGGRLSIANVPNGASVAITLPVAEDHSHV